MRVLRVQRAAGHMAPEQLAVGPAHHPVVGVAALFVQGGQDAVARAFEFGRAGVEHLEGLADELFALGFEDGQQLPVAVDDQAVARHDHPDRGHFEGGSVIQFQHGGEA